MATHKADARVLLDDRGYRGTLIRGQNPALLFEKAVRDRITGSLYWLEQCYGLNAETLCDRAVKLDCVGGTYGSFGKPTPFLCLAFKLLQLVPEDEIILQYLNFGEDDEEREEVDDDEQQQQQGGDEEQQEGDDDKNGQENGQSGAGKKGYFKYLRALAAFYIRLTWKSEDIYKTLEPLLSDYRKLRRRVGDEVVLTFMDQFIDDLLTKERVCGTSLWKLPARTVLEDLDILEPRESALGDELNELDQEDASDGEHSRSYRSDSSSGSREGSEG
jgi:pre-mRNA-splicing factor 38A